MIRYFKREAVILLQKDKLIQGAVKLGIPLAAGTDLRYTTPDLSMADEAVYVSGDDKRTGAVRKGPEANVVVLGEILSYHSKH